jgi:hypothetical protein
METLTSGASLMQIGITLTLVIYLIAVLIDYF